MGRIPDTIFSFVQEYKARLNEDDEFRKLSKGVKASILMKLMPDANFPYLMKFLTIIDDGKCSDIKVLGREEEPDADCKLRMSYSTFMLIARGNLDVGVLAVLKGLIKFEKGMLFALTKMGLLKTIIRVLRDILAEYRGKAAIFLYRAEFIMPHAILGKEVREILSGLRAKKALIITDSAMVKLGFADELKKLLEMNGIKVSIFDGVKPEPPKEVVESAAKLARKVSPDVIIGLGGGSAMDTAKAVFVLYENPKLPIERLDPAWDITLRKKSRLILIPTTSGTGSEVTWASVITVMKDGAREKVGIGHRGLVADMAVIDPFFVYGLPKKLVSSTGLDALTHAIEGMVSPWRNELVMAVGLRAMKLLFKYLPKSYSEGDKEAREKVHYAATLAGLAFSNSQATLCHGLGHAFGATFHIPHGWAVAVFLPYVIDYYRNEAKEVLEEIAEELGVEGEDKIEGLKERIVELIKSVDGYTKLSDFGISEEEFKQKLDLLVELSKDDSCTYSGPRIPSDEEIRKLYEYAYYGKKVDF